MKTSAISRRRRRPPSNAATSRRGSRSPTVPPDDERFAVELLRVAADGRRSPMVRAAARTALRELRREARASRSK